MSKDLQVFFGIFPHLWDGLSEHPLHKPRTGVRLRAVAAVQVTSNGTLPLRDSGNEPQACEGYRRRRFFCAWFLPLYSGLPCVNLRTHLTPTTTIFRTMQCRPVLRSSHRAIMQGRATSSKALPSHMPRSSLHLKRVRRIVERVCFKRRTTATEPSEMRQLTAIRH